MDMGIAALAVVGAVVVALGGGAVFGFLRGKKKTEDKKPDNS